MKQQQKSGLKKAGLFLAIIAVVLVGIFIAFKLGIFLAPFLIACILSSLIEPVICIIEKRLNIKRKLAAPLVLLSIVLSLGFLLVTIILNLVSELKSIAHVLPGILSGLYIQISELINQAASMVDWFPPELAESVGNVISNLSNTLVKLANSIVKGAFATAISLPETFVFILITILSTYFISSDRDKIIRYIRNQLPESWMKKITAVKNDLFSALFGYIKAALILMAITFTELFIGFSIIHIKYALLLAFLAAVIDALPVLGTGSILIPWAVYHLITGNFRVGASIAILYIVVLIVRQMIEPKIVGQQIGVHPLLTLAAMYAGLQLIGFAGLILGPILFLLFKSIFSGIYKNKTLKDILNDHPSNTGK